MSLDKRLKDVLNDADNLSNPMSPDWDINVEKMSEAIKQAFIDEGWYKPEITTYTNGFSQAPQTEVVTRYERDKPTEYRVNGKIMMTGPEWLARFAVERHWLKLSGIEVAPEVMNAARRAAGVDE